MSVRALLQTLCLASLALRLSAGNLEKFALGEDAGLSAGAVVATAADPSSLYYNPAGLALLEKDSVDLGVSAYAARYYRVPRLVQLVLPDRNAGMDFSGTSFFSTPAAVVFGGRLRTGLGWGLAVFTREQLDLVGRLSETFEGYNGPARYAYEQGMELDFRVKDYLAGLGLGWQALPSLRLGASAFGEYVRQTIGTQFWGDYVDPDTYDSGTGQYGVHITNNYQQKVGVGAYGARAVAGLQWEALPGLILGATGRSPRFALYTDVEADILLNGGYYNGSIPATALVHVHFNGDGAEHPYVWQEPWRAEASLAYSGSRGWLALQADVSDRPDDEARGAVWNYKVGGLLHLSPSWDWGAGAYTDHSWGEAFSGFGTSRMDYYGANTGLRWKRLIGGSQDQPGRVELRTSFILHYERGYGELAGASMEPLNPQFPLPMGLTNAVFEEANAHLASGLAW